MCISVYLCMYMYVIGHICKVISLKSKVGQAKIFMKTCVEGIASKFSFLMEKKFNGF